MDRSDALDEVVRFAELTGSRVYQNWMSDVNFPVSHPQYLGDLDPTSPQAKGIFEEMDVLIGIGCSLFAQGFSTLSQPFLQMLELFRSMKIRGRSERTFLWTAVFKAILRSCWPS